jgi:tetratricopeptide (TPR) repeat protein
VLWHEFCHVITLQMTRNKMPRWLSEGISVYEERLANPTWGQAMNPHFREMILGDDFTPVGELSAAFLTPKSDLHLQFAYYESSLVVEFLVERYGVEALQKILRDLGQGIEINEALAKRTVPLDELEKGFAAFAQARAKSLAPGLDWNKPEPEQLNDAIWTALHTNNFYVLSHQARQLMRDNKWQEAKAPLETLRQLYPDHAEGDSALAMLAVVHRELNETNAERRVVEQLAGLDADAPDAYLRLMELAGESGEWPVVRENAERYLAVNPLVPSPYRFLAQACEATRQTEPAMAAYRTLLLLDPPDPADAHFRLARLLHQTGKPEAKRHVLQALEEAPRFRDAQRLLLEMTADPAGEKEPAPAAPGSTGR